MEHNYQIKIVKTIPNPEYKTEMAQYAEKNRYFDRGPNSDKGEPLREFIKDALIVELNEEQFKKVKLEILKVFE